VKGVILAAGKGTRMLPLTQRRPKPLVPVLDRPMIEHIILGAREAGVDHIALIVGHLGQMLRDHLGDGSRLGVRLEYIEQHEMRGTGHAALLAEDFVAGDPFFMSWGDIIVPARNYARVVSAFVPGETAAVLSLNWVEDPYEGAAVYVAGGHVQRIQEKPPRGTATTHFNNAGLFVYGADFFARLHRVKPSPRGEIELPDAVQEMIAEGCRIRGVELEGYWSDVARPGTVLSLNALVMADRYPEAGGVFVHPTASVSPGTSLVGPVNVGAECVVEEGAQLGPNVALMEACRVQKGALLEEVAMFTGARVGGRARGRHCLFEEGAVLEDGAVLEGSPGAPCVLRCDGTLGEVPA
jgi:UDP-N-acetylglucosamine diphosphorylase / glucose-1-phosphate thymidylyltransferase / UDP-N-acetylgalactosamine diphosphorylase / glucosamine-1-phosphate N-acetyltransferase / galactosamine-1-phosphate N-acetyltransferase